MTQGFLRDIRVEESGESSDEAEARESDDSGIELCRKRKNEAEENSRKKMMNVPRLYYFFFIFYCRKLQH